MAEELKMVKRQSNPNDPKVLTIRAELLRDKPDPKFDMEYSGLNPEQLVKIVLTIIRNLSIISFKELSPYVDHRAYGTRLQPPQHKPGHKHTK